MLVTFTKLEATGGRADAPAMIELAELLHKVDIEGKQGCSGETARAPCHHLMQLAGEICRRNLRLSRLVDVAENAGVLWPCEPTYPTCKVIFLLSCC